MVRCWLEKDPESAAVPAETAEAVIAEITRLADLLADVKEYIGDPLTYFPVGWEFWGPGIPHPIWAYRDEMIAD